MRDEVARLNFQEECHHPREPGTIRSAFFPRFNLQLEKSCLPVRKMSRRVSWNADGALVTWLESSKNYRRWKQGPHKLVIQEIQEALGAADVHRTT
jgi:hypothetical protein